MKKVILGIVPAPGLPAKICYKLLDQLQDTLQEVIPGDTTWKVEIEIDRLTGAAEKVKDIMEQAIHLKKTNKWDFSIALTDLPIFYDKSIVLSDIDTKEDIAQFHFPHLVCCPP